MSGDMTDSLFMATENIDPAARARFILTTVIEHEGMDADDLDGAWLADAIGAGLVVNVRGFIYPAGSRHA